MDRLSTFTAKVKKKQNIGFRRRRFIKISIKARYCFLKDSMKSRYQVEHLVIVMYSQQNGLLKSSVMKYFSRNITPFQK